MVKMRHSRHQLAKATGKKVVWTMLLTLSVVLFIHLAFQIFSLPVTNEDFLLDDSTNSHMQRETIEDRNFTEFEGLGDRGKQWSEVISWEPRAFLYHNFLSREECEYLINLGEPHLKKSSVVDANTGKIIGSWARTSSGMFLDVGQDKIIKAIEKRISDCTFIPVENGEGLQILRYEVGEKYEPHYDYFLDDFNTRNGDQRVATLLMYLSDVEEGGETQFPLSGKNISSIVWDDKFSEPECGKGGLQVKPKMGNALLFWSVTPDYTLDSASLHGSCPVIRGTKWSATKWLHVKQY